MVRFHFYPFPSPTNFSNSKFNVSASGFSLLSNFSLQNTVNLPIIQEFLLTINVSKFKIFFTPSRDSSFAFVNAIEAFLTPTNFVPDSAPYVTVSGEKNDYNGLMSHVLHPILRINVGGSVITQDNGTLWRNWVPDGKYIYSEETAITREYTERLNYQDGEATKYHAPDLVYKTAKQLNIDPERGDNNINISWNFDVGKNSTNLVRAHFCDIVSRGLNVGMFDFYIFTQFNVSIQPSYRIQKLAAPFYIDFVVDSDSSGYINISIGPHRDSTYPAFLNGLEIMEVVKDLGLDLKSSEGGKKSSVVIIGSVAGGVGLLFILVGVLLFGLKYRKAKPVENVDWNVVPQYGGDSYSMITDRTGNNASPLPNLNLGLKVPFAEILRATQNFNPKLMIGEGGFGKVYKGVLTNGTKVAVKRSEPGHGQGLPEFQTEIMVLSRMRHKHLVSLIGYCDERSEMILVYEFMEKGTLKEHLYSSNGDRDNLGPDLSWNQRLEICIGAAKGLHYLHTGAGGIIHRDVKSTNILLDEHYVAKVADFGISRLGPLDQSQTHVSTDIKGSFGYLDPEYFTCLKLTQKSDVYSFGVVLLEVLCARQAINNLLPRDEVNLAYWAISWLKKGEIERIVDPALAGKINPNSLRKFRETVEKCLKDYGDERPSMIDVLWDLEYSLQLQQTTMVREPHEDSTADASWDMGLPVLHRLPSDDIAIDDSDVHVEVQECSDTSYTNSVFSQLKMDDAR